MAYAAVISAMQKIDRLRQSFLPIYHRNIERFQYSSLFQLLSRDLQALGSTYEELSFLESILKEHISEMKGINIRFDPLEQQIQDAADKIEDLLESRLASNGFPSEPETEIFSQQLHQVKQQISSFTGGLMKNKEHYYSMEPDQERETTDEAVPSIRIYDFGGNIKYVGLKDEVGELLNWATRGSSNLQIKSVFGMVGIGKTTLVQQVYNHESVVHDFDLRFWVTLGPNYKLEEFCKQFLDNAPIQVKVTHKNMEYIYKLLKGWKYLVVLDDVWSAQAWDEVRMLFPNDGNRSRIILTSRLFNVASYADTGNVCEKRFLNDEDSWSLLHQRVFTDPQEHCTPKLRKFGMKIAQNCEGLPLAILAVAKQLRKIEKTVEYWEEVSEQENLYDIIKDDYANILEPLALSYNMLPRRLKECFLYIGIVPNYKISVAKLIKLWVVEGFLRSQMDTSIEDGAKQSLHELVSQSVALIDERSSQGGIKVCRIHFVFRSLCISEAQNEKFCYVVRKFGHFPQDMQRLCIHNNSVLAIKEVHNTMKSISTVRSLLCLGPHHPHPLQVYLSFRLLKVLNVLSIRFFKFPLEVLELVRLKYFAITFDGKLPESISKLWNLEVLIVGRHHSVILSEARPHMPMQIWNLKWLRHLQCMGIDVLDPCTGDNGCNHAALNRLITLSGVSARSCSRGVLARMPNLEKLGISIELAPGEVETFSFFDDVAEKLHNLQSFKCTVLGFKSQVGSPIRRFPISLRKLSLSGCRFPWKYMAAISWLPCLKILKLRCYAFCGPRWELCEDDFPCLELLLLEDLDIREWMAEETTFPKLRRLMIRHCYKLREISVALGDVPTLEMMELDDCSPSFASLVGKIKEEQRENGNEDVQFSLKYSWHKKKLKSQS